jgi:hypothetical protein
MRAESGSEVSDASRRQCFREMQLGAVCSITKTILLLVSVIEYRYGLCIDKMEVAGKGGALRLVTAAELSQS